jgi:hypothetical protein
MTKNILLAAASVMALGFAGAASAADLSLTIGGETVTATNAYTLASEIEGEVTGEIVAAVAYDDELPQADNIKLTFTLSNGATFAEAVSSGDLTGFAQVIISEGGTAGSSSVTFLASGPTAPVAPATGSSATLTTDISFEAGATPGIQVRTTTENNTPIEGGNEPSSPLTFIDYESFLVAEATPASTNPYYATIDSGFTVFSNGVGSDSAVLGTVTVDFAEDVFIDLNATVADEDQFEEAVVTINGSSTNIDYTVSDGATVDGDEITISAPGTYTVTANADGDAVNTSSYSATADISFGPSYEDVSDRALGSLSSILREGTSAVVPWVASNTLGSVNNTRNVVRISNSADVATGQVYLEVVTSAAAQGVNPTFTVGLVATGLTVPAAGDLQISSAQMEQFLGGDFRRADIRVTVEAAAEDLIFRSRIAQGNGTVEEIQLEPEVGPSID